MTDQDLTAPEAVERLAARLYTSQQPSIGQRRSIAATLRALSAALEKVGVERDEWKRSYEVCALDTITLTHRAESAEAKLKESVSVLKDMRDDKTGYRHAVHFRRRAAVYLASIEGTVE